MQIYLHVTYGYQRGNMGGGVEQELGFLYSTTIYSVDNWDSAPYSVITYPRKESEKEFVVFVVVVESLSLVQLFATPWTAACQAPLSLTVSRSLVRLMSIESVMPSNHLILCHPPFLLPSVFPSIKFFSKKSALCVRWPKYWSFSNSPSNEYSVLVSFRID